VTSYVTGKDLETGLEQAQEFLATARSFLEQTIAGKE
jgi:hypothetical protein